MKRIALVILSLFPLLCFSQNNKSVPRDKKLYLAEITTMFETLGKEDEINFLYQFFVPKWNEMTEAEEIFVYDISDLLLQKQYKPSPHLYHFLSSIYYFKDGKGGENLQAWKNIVQKLIQASNRTNAERFLETAFLLLRDNTLYESNAVSWKVQADNFTFRDDSIPSVIFKNAGLEGRSKGDMTQLSQVSGVYVPSKRSFFGSEGRLSWAKTGLNPDKNYATFTNFEINLASTLFDVEKATMHTEYYKEALQGKLREKILSSKPASYSYPSFESDNRSLEIVDILPNMDYSGGFAIRGAEFAGIGLPGIPSKVILKHKGKPFLEAQSLDFTFDTAKVQAPLAGITIRLGKDSLVHSGLKFRYDRKKSQVELIRDDNSSSSGPMYSSYHELDFFVERLSWVNGDSIIEMGTLKGTAQNVATFESNNFFNEDRFKALQFPNGPHPLVQLRTYCNQNKERDFSVKDYSDFLNVPESVAKQILIDLANKGFLNYDYDADYVVVKKKLFDFLLANQKKIDHDVILFESKVKSSIQPNATLNINSNDLNIFGVKQISFSDAQSVAFFADKRTPYITVQKNRNMRFAGVLRAGGFDFYGDSFVFNYDKFKVDLLKVDSVMLYIKNEQKDSLGARSVFVPVQTKIKDISGELFIDNPINKSGRDTINNKAFPILRTNEEAFTYYDKDETYEGIYNREKFFFKLDPFELDSLDNFNQEVLRFTGKLVSAGIFPDIIDSLSVQEDFSLGFKHQTPTAGLPMYGEKAVFKNQISLSDKGLMGDGDLVYVTSTSHSKRFTFFPDSTTGIAQKVINDKQASPDVPQFAASDISLRFLPMSDFLEWQVLKEKVHMFNDDARMVGTLKLSPQNLSGKGLLQMFDGELKANAFRFNASNAFADTADFKLNAIGSNALAISTEEISAQIDFNYRVGTFRALSGAASITFPKNKYKASMDTYKWLVDDKLVEMSNSSAQTDSIEGAGARFVSIHPDQDSLSFRVGRAIYDVSKYQIQCYEVPKILVADVLVVPDGGEVTILADAVIKPLQNAVITADFVNRFHTIFNATVEILSAKNYLAKGDYNYEDDEKNQQKINFQTIYVDSTRHSYAKGMILEDMNFKLNKYFDYRGQVVLKAQDKGLHFNGSTRIMTNCEKIERNWLAFSGQVDPKDVLIPVGKLMKNDLGQEIGAGIMMHRADSTWLYPTFISAKINPLDTAITTALGYLWYNKDESAYQIGSMQRFRKQGLEGNMVSLNTKTCDISAEGNLGFGADFGQVQVNTVGKAQYSYKNDAVSLQNFMMVDFYFEPKILEYLAVKSAAFPFIQPINLSTTFYEKALTEYAPKKRAELVDEYNKKGLLGGIPAEMAKPLVFADVRWNWDEETGSFVSDGLIGLMNTYNKPIMLYLNGKMQVLRSKRGSELVMYFEFDPNTWYFFKYKKDENPRMIFYSSDADFMKLFEVVKEKDRKLKTKKDEASYEYDIAPRTSKDTFFERFE